MSTFISTTCQRTSTPTQRNAGLKINTGCKANTESTNQTAFRGIIERDPATDTKNPAAGQAVPNIGKLKVSTPLQDSRGFVDKPSNVNVSN